MRLLKKHKVLFFCALSIALVIVVLSLSLAHKHVKRSQELIVVDVTAAQQKDVTVYTSVVGNVQAHASVAIKSLVDGQLLQVNFKEGDFVKTGQVLFVIDQRPFLVKLQQAKANLARDMAQLTAAKSSVERNSKLVSGGYVAKQDFDQLKSNQDALMATVQNDQAAVADAELQLSYCTIVAPLTGRTGNLLVNSGNLVKANDATALVVINQITPIDVKFSLPETQLAAIAQQLRRGAVLVDAVLTKDSKIVQHGTVSFVDNTVDTQSGMIQLKASFANTDQYLWPGQFVQLQLPIDFLSKQIVIPTSAVQIGQNGAYVYVVKKDNTVAMRAITTGPVVGDNTVILKGLASGELVVTSGQLRLTDGTKVQYKK